MVETPTLENAVERHFCEKFDVLKRHPMTIEQSEIMFKLIFMSMKDPFIFDEDVKPNFLTQIIHTRFSILGYTMDAAVNLFISLMAETPGGATMYVHYLAYKCKKRMIDHLTLEEMNMYIFPFGFPSSDDLHILWDQQKIHRIEEMKGIKGPTDNLLDFDRANISIKNIKS